MRALNLFFLLLFFLSCKKNNPKFEPFPKNTGELILESKSVYSTDKLMDSLMFKYKNTTNASKFPIKISSVELRKNEYSNFKDIYITFDNIGHKDIQAIKFQWFSINSLNKPSNLRNFFMKGESCGLTTKIVKKKSSSKVVFNEFSSDANYVIKARVYEVFFTDGTAMLIENQAYLEDYLLKSE